MLNLVWNISYMILIKKKKNKYTFNRFKQICSNLDGKPSWEILNFSSTVAKDLKKNEIEENDLLFPTSVYQDEFKKILTNILDWHNAKNNIQVLKKLLSKST